ncbi:MAG TPA: DoxX family protein [Chitinophagaceae bacterium]|nr:DoxX family protein [Chitinophagaceae bacterium]
MLGKIVFTPDALWEAGAVILRVATGLIIFKYGLEIFSAGKMQGYTDWLNDLNFPAPETMAYAGKLCELTGGILMVLGLFIRLAAIPLLITMSVTGFVMGEPEFLAADGSILLLLIFLHFLLVGPGKFSLDHILFTKKNAA